MEQRELIKEIPSGKFHSALFTTFSINLYYWEEQLVRALSSRGINYVSALVDSGALSEQLLKFGQAYRGTRPFDFCLHGVKARGAFHPKIQFYAGEKNVLVLIGSGNLTITGHGKNLEVWSPIMIDSADSPLFPFVRDVWNYLKELYLSLGKEAEYIASSVESNCELLKTEYHGVGSECRIDDDSIRFFSNANHSLFSQCVDWIGDDKIRIITVMSPFYDNKAELVKELYRQFKPQKIRMIYEEGFGVTPQRKYIPEYLETYKWSDVRGTEKSLQRFFHSKCFFFEGERNNYVLTGSANASVAAFGLSNASAINQEAVVGMKSTKKDFFRMTGLALNEKSEVEDSHSIYNTDTLSNANDEPVWIKEVYIYYSNYSISIDCREGLRGATAHFYSGRRHLIHSQKFDVASGTHSINGTVTGGGVPLYVEIVNYNGEIISNRQFVISAERVETNNPSPESTYFRKKYYEIEAGKFINGEMMRFLDQIINDTCRKSSSNEMPTGGEGSHKDDRKFSTLEEYLMDDGQETTEYMDRSGAEKSKMQTTLFFDSIISYITRSADSKQEEVIDDEENEDVATSEGSEKPAVRRERMRESTADSVKQKIHKMFGEYIGRMESVLFPEQERQKQENVVQLNPIKKFMAAEYFIYRTLSYRYVLDGYGDEKQTLIELKKDPHLHNTATEYFYRIVSLFSVYLMRSTLQDEENAVLRQKIDSYKQYAFELGIAIFSVCDWINEGNQPYQEWSDKYKTCAVLNLRKALGGNVDDISVNSIYKRIDRAIQEMEGFDKWTMEQYIHDNLKMLLDYNDKYSQGQILYTEQFGYVNLIPLKQDVTAIPCTVAAPYNTEKKCNCPNYLYVYNSNKLLPIKPPKKKI